MTKVREAQIESELRECVRFLGLNINHFSARYNGTSYDWIMSNAWKKEIKGSIAEFPEDDEILVFRLRKWIMSDIVRQLV